MNIILAEWPDQIAEDFAIACAYPDSALVSFRALVEEKRERDAWARLNPTKERTGWLSFSPSPGT